MKIYIAGPLFNDIELKRNMSIDAELSSMGYSTYLPQRDGGQFAQLLAEGYNAEEVRDNIFTKDIEAVANSDILLFILDGRVPDEGACFELGYARALCKKCIGLKTDTRAFMQGYDNIMLTGALDEYFTEERSLMEYLKKLLAEV